MQRAAFAMLCVMTLAACGPAQTADPADDFSDLVGLDTKSDRFSSRLLLLGSLQYGQTSDLVTYHNPPRYRGFTFTGNPGDVVDVWVRSPDRDADGWILDAQFRILAHNDNAEATTTDSHMVTTLPAGTNATYTIVFREVRVRNSHFTVSLDATTAVDAGADDAGSDAGDAGSDAGDAGDAGGAAIQTVFLVLMENTNWDDIEGSSEAPYINGTLLPMASFARSYKGANGGGLHPSEPNYIWLEAGNNLGIGNDDSPAQGNHLGTSAHLVRLLDAAGISWKSYQEGIPGNQCPIDAISSAHYAPKHDPMLFFEDSDGFQGGSSFNRADPYCIAHNRPLSELATDLQNNTAARYNFITPNLCNDMHDDCGSGNIRQGDDFLRSFLGEPGGTTGLLHTAAFQNGGALFVTWDEAEFAFPSCLLANCPIGMIVVSPLAKGGGYHNTIAYDHSSTLKSLQEIFGVTPLLGHAADSGVHDLADLFTTFP